MSLGDGPKEGHVLQGTEFAPALSSQAHGSMPYGELRELGMAPSDVLDFSATVNPYPLPDSIVHLFSAEGLAAYPDSDCHEAVAALALSYDIPEEWIAVTAGLTEAIFVLPRLHATVVQFSPTYGDYALACSRHNRRIGSIGFPLSQRELYQAIDTIRSQAGDLVIICNPNNPDGRYLPIERVRELCEALPDVTICVDESYQEMGERCDTAIPVAAQARNLLVLKSLTKPFGIGGVRVACAISSGIVIKRMRDHLLPWGVSTIAQRIVPELVGNRGYFERQWNTVHPESVRLMRELRTIGVVTERGRCPFFLAHVGDATGLRARMLREHRVVLRDCTSFGMPDMVRIMPSIPTNNDRLVAAFSSRRT